MTQISIANIGSYPRIGEDKDQQRHRRGLAHFEKKDISAHAFRDVEQSYTQEIIREQLNYGLDEVTDGCIAWQDPISHFCKNVTGIEMAGLARYFNTNFYYRAPVIVSMPRLKTPVLAKDFVFSQSVSSKSVRAVITGPFTLATHTSSEIKSFSKLSSRLDFFTDLVKSEVKALVAAGARTIQIDEPSLALQKNAFSLVKKSLDQIITGETSTKFVLALYYSSLAPLWDGLQTLPVGCIMLDFTYDHEDLLKKVMEKPGLKDIGFGLLDARNTKMESPEVLAEILRCWNSKNPGRKFWLTPSSGLELLPRNAAQQKLQLLSKVRDLLNPSTRPAPVYG